MTQGEPIYRARQYTGEAIARGETIAQGETIAWGETVHRARQ